MPVEVVHWNPLRPAVPGRLGRLVPVRRRVNNFGDLLGPLLVGRILREHGVRASETARASGRLVAVGSIMKLARPGDVVWGAGVNGKSQSTGAGRQLDVRAVRGPRTRDLLLSVGATVPEVYGDPGILWSRFWPRESLGPLPSARVVVVPNLHDWPEFANDPRAVDPTSPVDEVIARIVGADFVCGSSLHGVVIAESYGIPARLLRAGAEPAFKYEDYYLGTGRPGFEPADSVGDALAQGGETPPAFDADALLAAFPIDLWR